MAGSIINRGKNTWKLQISCGSDASGKRIRYTKTFHGTKREATKELNLFAAECQKGYVNKPTALTVDDIAQIYKQEYVDRFLKKTSQKSFNGIYKNWISPFLGNLKAGKVTRLEIQKFVNQISDKGRSPKTVRNIYAFTTGIFKYAVEMNLIADTPCKNIKLPKKEKVESKFYSLDDVNKMLKAIDTLSDEDYQYKIIIQIALFGGLRKGEILGLDWDDVDFENCTLHIQRSRQQETGGAIYEDTPKTLNSIRKIVLPEQIFTNLRSLKSYQAQKQLEGKYRIKSNAIFINAIGEPIGPQVLQRRFKKFCVENNLTYLGLHALRHTHASILTSMNEVDLTSMSKRLGHSQISTTLNIYTHLINNKEQQISNNLEQKFTIK